MGIEQNGAVRRNLRTLFNLGVVRELTDGQLLERFADDPGEVGELAFAALVERHGPMVLRVCRGVLGDRDEAHDAFQATFLVLVRRGRGLWVLDSIGPWLHQVAFRTASCARSRAARHRRLERKAARDEAVSESNRDFDLERILHEEIHRLPDRFRSVVVLCDLEGRSYEQVAKYLGWPVGTVKSRLSRGRECLRDRLIGRGLGPESRSVVGSEKLPAVLVPVSLLDAATAAATRYAAIGSGLGGASVTLAEGVLRTMTISSWWKFAAVVVVAGATASGAGWAGSGPGPGTQNRPDDTRKARKAVVADDVLTVPAKRSNLEFVRGSRGVVESGPTVDLLCNVVGGTTILKIVPEGKAVKKGEILAELDSSTLKDQLVNQRITTKSAEASYVNAKLTRELAEVAVREDHSRQALEIADLTGLIDDGKAAIRRTEERLEHHRAAALRVEAMLRERGGAKTSADVVAEVDLRDRIDEAERALEHERRSLSQSEGKLEILRKYTHPRTIQELGIAVKRAHMNELAKQVAWELEASKEPKLERQIALCTLVAPIDGLVVYGNDPLRTRAGNPSSIEEGATVRERQRIIRIVDVDAPMQVYLQVPEAWVDRLAPRMRVRVKVDAFPDQVLEGEIVEIASLPDPNLSANRPVKIYPTLVRLDRAFPGLRPGMTANAEIVITRRENIIAVPIEAFHLRDDKPELAVKRPDGSVEWREVVAGVTDDQKVEVKEGLHEGDQVILDPSQYVQGSGRRPAVPPSRKKAARRKGD